MDIIAEVAEVAEVAANAQTVETITWSHETDRRARRAQTLPFSRCDLGGWAAVITGPDARYGLARRFLDKSWPVAWAKRPRLAVDCTTVQAGNIIQMHGFQSRSTQEDRFYRVLRIDDTAITLVALTVQDVLATVR